MRKCLGWMMVAAVLAMGSSAFAATIVIDTWEGASTENWGIGDAPGYGNDGQGNPVDGAYGTISQGSLDGQNALIIDGGGISAAEEDWISADTTADALYVGDYGAKGVESILFNFYDGEGLTGTDDLRVYFYSSTDAATWYYDVSTSLGWNEGGVNFDSGAAGAWYSEDVGADWATAVADVDEVGMYIRYLDGIGSQDYGLDNFQLNDDPIPIPSPEPETYAMLGFAMLGLCVTFRRKLEDSLHVVAQHLRS